MLPFITFKIHKLPILHAGGSGSNSKVITFPTAFKSYNMVYTSVQTTRGAASYDGEIFVRAKSLTQFTAGSRLNDVTTFMWFACGY